MIRDLLVHVDATEDGRSRLGYALSMAAVLGARLTGAHVRTPVDLPPLYKPSALDRAIASEEARLSEAAVASETLFEEATRDAVIPVRWRALSGNMAGEMCGCGCYADLLIVGQYDREGASHRHPYSLADDVLQGGCCPVVVTPSQVGGFAMDRVLVAWDGRARAARALHDALPLMGREAEITILTVGTHKRASKTGQGHDSLIDHLIQHGFRKQGLRSAYVDGSDTSTILDEIRAGGFDMLIIGAYSHPAWLELLLGGTTFEVLRASPIPVFLSH